jgi:hypothetical protein
VHIPSETEKRLGEEAELVAIFSVCEPLESKVGLKFHCPTWCH